jgi:hypothetical protein
VQAWAVPIGITKLGRELRERDVLAQVDQGDQGVLVGAELAASVALAGDGEHGAPLRMVVVRGTGCS